MPTPANRDDLVRCGYDPPSKKKIQSIFVISTTKIKEEQYCIFFNITYKTLEHWVKEIRKVLREDSGVVTDYESKCTVDGEQDTVYAKAGPRKWWQLEPGHNSDFYFQDDDLVSTIANRDPLKRYFAGNTGPGAAVDDTNGAGKLVKRWVPSARMKDTLLYKLVMAEANTMKGESRLWKAITEKDMRRTVPINPDYGEGDQPTPSRNAKRQKVALKFKDCFLVIYDAPIDTDVADLPEDQYIVIEVIDLVRGKQGQNLSVADVSWASFRGLVEEKWTLGMTETQKCMVKFETRENEEVSVRSKAGLLEALELLYERAVIAGEKRMLMRYVVEDRARAPVSAND